MNNKELAALQKPVPKTAMGLRDALFDEINLLRAGKSSPQKARIVAQLAHRLIEATRMEIAHTRNLVDVKASDSMQLGTK